MFKMLEGLLNYRVLVPNLKVSDSVGLEYGMKICIYSKFLSDTDADGPRTTLSLRGDQIKCSVWFHFDKEKV